ncbi:hypothetical protein K3X13_09275 [Aliiroseovarius crassostreae]|uniref:hypothetical protein n=1 Tax=Aliiroseovarius crassostreae TaxID=154981 RepID=UPI0021FF4C9F|nr:hypothetical protein [Aliiroseovarius crassostreae]UWP91278.1 hypothetical protein K3X13_09275 [Aliiroseovarius crassostreae]
MEQTRHPFSGTPINAETPRDRPLLPLHPAEELADIRRQISRLRKREAELRHHLLCCTDPDAREDPLHRVVIKTTRSKVFDTTLLPPAIQSNPRFFATREQTRVCVLPTERPARRLGLFSGKGLRYRPDGEEFGAPDRFSEALRGD